MSLGQCFSNFLVSWTGIL